MNKKSTPKCNVCFKHSLLNKNCENCLTLCCNNCFSSKMNFCENCLTFICNNCFIICTQCKNIFCPSCCLYSQNSVSNVCYNCYYDEFIDQ